MTDSLLQRNRGPGPTSAVASHSGHSMRPGVSGFLRYYPALEKLCREVRERHGAFVVLDLHSYNHRRHGPDGPAADPKHNPEVNIGTRGKNRRRLRAAFSTRASQTARLNEVD